MDMRILFVSDDKSIKDILFNSELISKNRIKTVDNTNEPVEVLELLYSFHPSILIIDDDFMKPNSSKIITSSKKVNEDISIVFLTEDASLESGREVIPLGIEYYAIKPVTRNELLESLHSIINHQLKKTKSHSNN